MSREIKFRAWAPSLKVMQEPFTPTDDRGMLGRDGEIHLEDYVVMQYTGLKDKNGVEIYEGDILKHHGHVVWNQAEFRWSCVDLTWNDQREWHDFDYLTSPFEIIGNIYENPELLSA